MIFLSQLLNVPVIDSRQNKIGSLKDLIVEKDRASYPRVKGIILKTKNKKALIPYNCIENLSPGEITLKKTNCWKFEFKLLDKEFSLGEGLLDQQIFDVKGIRVVRVNDLQLAKIKEDFCLIGIDISNRALLRRLHLVNFPFFNHIKSTFIDWNDINLIKDKSGGINLKISYQNLQKLHPADIANLIENLSLHQSTEVVQSLDKEMAADVLEEVEDEYKDTLIEKMSSKSLANIVEEMPTDEAVDLIQDLSEAKKVQVYRRLDSQKAKVIDKLTSYDNDTAGGFMTSEYLAVFEDATVGETIEKIRKNNDEYPFIYHILIINKKKNLLGIISIRTLLLASKKEKISNLMSKTITTIHTDMKAREIARIMTKYNLLSLAVTDKQGKILGIVTVDDIMRFLLPDA